jgi:hypothetical protein
MVKHLLAGAINRFAFRLNMILSLMFQFLWQEHLEKHELPPWAQSPHLEALLFSVHVHFTTTRMNIFINT